MKKRLRKKKHLGEFREYGVHVCVIFKDSFDDNALCGFVDFLDSFDLDCCGGGNGKRDIFFVFKHRGSVTIEDTYKIAEWLKNSPLVKSYGIGPLVDAWHCPDKDFDRIYDELESIVGIK